MYKLIVLSIEGKWRTSPGSQEDDVTPPELVITKGNGGSPEGQECILTKKKSVYVMTKDIP